MNKSLKRGLLFTAIGTYSNFFCQLIIQMVLSRLLTPEDYGVVAIMQVFILFFALMIEAGMGPAIIQNKGLSDVDNRILFNYSFLIAIIIAIIFGFFGIILSAIYDNSIYITLTWIQSISILFNGLNVVPVALLNKNKQFNFVNFTKVMSNLFSGIVGITCAFWGLGVYALIFSAIAASVTSFLLNRFFIKIKFIKSWDTKAIKEVWEFSKNQFIFNFVNYFSRNSDNILIGKFMGATDLANYNKSYQLLLLPTQLIANIISPVLQPVLSDFQDDVAYIRNFYFKLLHLMALIGFPLSFFLSISAEQIIYFMFGPQWTSAILPFSILSLTVWIQLMISSTGAILQSRNHSKLLVINGILSSLILVSSIITGVIMGTIATVAICYSLGATLVFFINFYNVIVKSLEGSYSKFIKELFRPFILGLIVALFTYFFSLININSIILDLALRSLLFLGVMVSYIYFTSEKKFILKIFKDRY